jgi:hypothetical protein
MPRLAALLMVPVAVFVASCGLFHTTSRPAGIGQEVLDGNFAFIVSHVNTSPTFGHTPAQGVYAIVSMAGQERRHRATDVRVGGSEVEGPHWA